jgi:peptide/nickel transport system substrate-binding protein
MLKELAQIMRLSFLMVASFIFLAAILVADFALAKDNSKKDYGDAIVGASIADARTLVPILASDGASSEICGMIFNGLVKYDKDINLVGDLADSWEITNDGLVIVFHLRKNVRWHDGFPFTARDVEFTFQKLIDPNVKTPYSGDFERVKSLEVVDDYTLKVTYKEPFVPALSSWGMAIIPKHLLEKEDLNTTKFSRHPIGTGPYKFKSWKTQEKIELEANPDYFEHKPFIGRYISRVIPDESTIFLELQTQGVDSSGISPLQYTRQTDTSFFKKHYRKFRLPSFSYLYLGYNLRDVKFSDKRVRQALNYAVDKDEIIKIVLLGLGKVATGPYLPGTFAYNESVLPASFNPDRARELLKDAGWVDLNNDGWLEKDGKRFEFTILTNQGNEERLKVAQIIQRRLKEVGIKVNVRVVEWSVFLTEFIEKRKFETVLLGWSLPREPDNYDIWHSSKTGEGQFNFVGYKNAEIDDLLTQGRRTFDQEKRKVFYQKAHEILYDDQPYMFIYVPDGLSILHNRFEGIVPAPIGIGYNFIDWWVPKAKQKYK